MRRRETCCAGGGSWAGCVDASGSAFPAATRPRTQRCFRRPCSSRSSPRRPEIRWRRSTTCSRRCRLPRRSFPRIRRRPSMRRSGGSHRLGPTRHRRTSMQRLPPTADILPMARLPRLPAPRSTSPRTTAECRMPAVCSTRAEIMAARPRPIASRRSARVRFGFSSGMASASNRSTHSMTTQIAGSTPSTRAACSTRCSSGSCEESSSGRSCPRSIGTSMPCCRSSTTSWRRAGASTRH